MDGYTVTIQVAMNQGPCPRFEKHFPPSKPVSEAVDQMAGYPLDFFQRGSRGLPNR